MRVLVTGGAGYIGAHVVRDLLARGDEVVVVDDLSTGDVARIPRIPLERFDLSAAGAAERLAHILRGQELDAVIHFAARKRVDESVRDPELYERINVGSVRAVLAALRETGTRRLVFSSSAAVYGAASGTVTEESATEPISPYGATKLEGERLIAEAARAGDLAAASLRYFNVAGVAAPELAEPEATNLVPQVLRRIAAGERPQIYGTDYETVDGTCIRDFVDVRDLSAGHLAVLDQLDPTVPGHRVYNVGTGRGASVAEVIGAISRELGIPDDPEHLPRRPGDPAAVVADVARITREVGWRARYGLEDIVRSAVEASGVR